MERLVAAWLAVGAAGCGAQISVDGSGGEAASSAGNGGSSASGLSTGPSTGTSPDASSGSAGNGTTGSGSGSSASTTSGGSTASGGPAGLPPPSASCQDCAQELAEDNGLCEALLDACEGDTACGLLLDCYDDCAFTGACVDKCNGIVPSGVSKMTDMMQCIACGVCKQLCAGSSVGEFCN